jgi:large subunit ribosomal protein L25
VDITDLDIHNSIHLSDLDLDPEIEVLTPLNTSIFTVVPPKVEEVPAEEEEGEVEEIEEGEAEPEVIGKGKPKEGEEESE